MSKLPAIAKPASLAKMARDALLNSILSGELNTGEVYNEMALAKDLGISRTPVREALLELSVLGFIQFIPRRGVVVNRFDRQDIDEIFELRKALETAIVETAARTDPPADLVDIEKTLSDQRAAMADNDYAAFLNADRSFHVTFSRLTHNGRMTAILENLRDMIHMMGTRALQLNGRAETVVSEHERIIDAVGRRDPEGARAAMLRHLEESEKAVITALG